MKRAVLLVLSAYYALALPALVFAQGAGVPSKLVPCTGVACKCSDLVTLAQNLINIGVFLFVLLAAGTFAYAGFLYLTNEAIKGQGQAKSMLTHAAGGLVLILIAWLVVDTLMKSLLGGDFGPWNAIAPLDDACRSLGIQ